MKLLSSAGGDYILRAHGLCRQFSGFMAVNGVDLAVRRHHIHALIGPNGAGKTTCFNLLTQFLPLSRGRIEFDGTDITGAQPADVARLGLVRSFQISSVFPHMTVLENVRIALQGRTGLSFKFWRSERLLHALDEQARGLLRDVGLGGAEDSAAAALSYGQKRALEIATTIALAPKMILLDEPMAGIAHGDIDMIASLIRRFAVGRTVLMVEHNLQVVARLCDRITVLHRGEVLTEGSYAEVSANPAVVEAYMGAADD